MEIPSNSNVGKEREQKSLEKVTTGEVTRRKQPLTRRFLSTFVAGDPKKVVQDVIFDVLIPAARDMIIDGVTRGFEQWVYGDNRMSRTRANSRPSGANGYVSYNRFASSTVPSRRDDDRQAARPAKNANSVDDLIVGTRVEAQAIIDRMFDIVNRWEQASVHDLYELVGVTGDPIDTKWGWTSMEGATFRRINDGYLLMLPKLEPLRS